MRIIRITLTFFLLSFISTGCWDYQEMENMHYMITLGIDYKDEEYIIYAKLINFSALKGLQQGGGGGQVDQVEIGIGKGKTVNLALHDLYEYTQRVLFLDHISAIVFSVRSIQHSLPKAIEFIGRSSEIRDTVWIFATDDPLESLLTVTPVLNHSVIFSLFGEPESSYYQSSIVQPINKFRFRRELQEPGMTTLIPNISLSKNRWLTEKGKDEQMGINGVHFIQGEAWKALLLDDELKGIRWLQQPLERAPFLIKAEDELLANLIMKNSKLRFEIEEQKEEVSFLMKVKVEGNILEIIHPLPEEQLREKAEKGIQEEITQLFRKGVEKDTDIFQLSNHLYRHDRKLWKKVTEKGQLKLTPELLSAVDVEVVINHANKNKMRSRR